MNTQILQFTGIVAFVISLGIVAWAFVRNRANRIDADVQKQKDHNKALIDATNIAVSLVNLAGPQPAAPRALPPGTVRDGQRRLDALKEDNGAVRTAAE